MRFNFSLMLKTGIPHPSVSWLAKAKTYIECGDFILAPIIGLQTSVFSGKKSPNKKYVALLFTPYSKWFPHSFLFALLQRSSLKKADIIVGNSATIIRKFGLSDSKKVILIPHLFEHIESQTTSNFGYDNSFIWIGALSFRKGADRLISLIFGVRGSRKIKVIWTATKSSFLWLPLLKFFEKLDWCELLTNLDDDDLKSLMKTTSALLSTTRFESFGMTILEAASFGKGVVGLSAPGITETLPEESGGALYFNSILKLSNYIKNESNLRDLEILGSKAQNFASKKYSLGNLQKLWAEALI
jgi:glycosyltransferase involved in cell wall biosynthesis